MLREIGPDARAALPALTAATNDAHPGVRAVAVQAVARVGQGDPASVAALRDALRGGGDADYRWKAARALGRLGPQAKDAVPGLVTAVADENGHVRREAIIALGRIGGSAEAAGAPALLRALEDPDPEIRRAAATALGRVQAAAARPALTRHLADEDEAVRTAAQRAIEKLAPEP